MDAPIYLDNHATTRVDPRVVDAMMPFFSEHYGNAASRQHRFGQFAHEAVETAREQVAALIGADLREIIFTSGATESDNLAIKGVARLSGQGRVITTSIEHHAVLDSCRRLEREGHEVRYASVDAQGVVSVSEILSALTPGTLLVSVMMANNEIGTIQPIQAIGRACKERGVLLHCDAAQAAGKIPIDVDALGVDLLSLSAHKMHGPKGVGALYVRRRRPHVQLLPIFDGGGHERGLRGGTIPVPLVVGFGRACEIGRMEGTMEAVRVARLRDELQARLLERIPDLRVNGHPEARLPNNLHVSLAHLSAQALMVGLPQLAVSSGSACTSASVEPSYVLRAIGLTDEWAHGSLRFGLSRFTTGAEIAAAADLVAREALRLRSLRPVT